MSRSSPDAGLPRVNSAGAPIPPTPPLSGGGGRPRSSSRGSATSNFSASSTPGMSRGTHRTVSISRDPSRYEAHARFTGSMRHATEGEVQRGISELIGAGSSDWRMVAARLGRTQYLPYLPHPSDGTRFPPPPPKAGHGPRGIVPEILGPSTLVDRDQSVKRRSLLVGHGKGILTDARTGNVLYEGEVQWGLRHGKGSGWIYDYRPVRCGSGGGPAVEEEVAMAPFGPGEAADEEKVAHDAFAAARGGGSGSVMGKLVPATLQAHVEDAETEVSDRPSALAVLNESASGGVSPPMSGRRRSHSGAPAPRRVHSMKHFRPSTPPAVISYAGLRTGTATPTVVGLEVDAQDWDAGAGEWGFVGRYDGEWVAGQRSGMGVFELASGDKYDGEWREDVMQGAGVLHFAGGGVLVANWDAGSPNGMAAMQWPWGDWEGRFYRAGKCVSTRPISQGQGKRAIQSILPADKALDAELWGAGLSPASSLSPRLPQISHAARQTPASTVTNIHVPPHMPSLHPSGSPVPVLGEVTRLLQNTTMVEVAGGRVRDEVATVNVDDTVETCLERLSHFHVLSMPVFDPALKRYVGMIHLLDICSSLVDLVGRKRPSLEGAGHLRETLAHQRRFNSQSVKDILEGATSAWKARQANPVNPSSNTSQNPAAPPSSSSSSPSPRRAGSPQHYSPSPLHRDEAISSTRSIRSESSETGKEAVAASPSSPVRTPDDRVPVAFRPVPSGVAVHFTARVLAGGVHAVPIVATDGTLERVVTQADVVRFLSTRLDSLGALGGRSIESLGIGLRAGRDMHIAHFSDITIDVMRKMRETGSSAAPVVNEYGALAANLSLSDLKLIAGRAKLPALRLPILQFFTDLELDKGANAMNPSICCKLEDPLSKIIQTLAATKVHQLYFVDDHVRPVGCVRCVDILRLVTGIH